jgi:hypothetical protein
MRSIVQKHGTAYLEDALYKLQDGLNLYRQRRLQPEGVTSCASSDVIKYICHHAERIPGSGVRFSMDGTTALMVAMRSSCKQQSVLLPPLESS